MTKKIIMANEKISSGVGPLTEERIVHGMGQLLCCDPQALTKMITDFIILEVLLKYFATIKGLLTLSTNCE